MSRQDYKPIPTSSGQQLATEFETRAQKWTETTNLSLQNRGDWAAATAYDENDVVTYQGGDYRALVASTGTSPDSDAAKWRAIGGGASGGSGAQGPQGERGEVGPQGAQGPAGAQGETGPQGAQGEQGPQGIQGAAGTDGQDGAQGPQGDPGPANGPQGPQGEIGPQGVAGTDGVDGAVGPKGDKGDKGDAGAQGPKGDTGDVGLQGAQGVKGNTGATGAKGNTGAQGPQGNVGPQGPKGDTGTAAPTSPSNGFIVGQIDTINGNGATATVNHAGKTAVAFDFSKSGSAGGAQTLTLSGSGTNYINGNYAQNEQNVFSREAFYKPGTDVEIRFDGGGYWIVVDYAFDDVLYSNHSTSQTVPLTGWEVENSSAPPPTFQKSGGGAQTDSQAIITDFEARYGLSDPQRAGAKVTGDATKAVAGGYPDSFTVSGAGSSEYNGVYTKGANVNGTPSYSTGSGGAKRYYHVGDAYGNWDWSFDTTGNGADFGSTAAYFVGVSSPSDPMPTSGFLTNQGLSPVPTISNLIGGSAPNSLTNVVIAHTPDKGALGDMIFSSGYTGTTTAPKKPGTAATRNVGTGANDVAAGNIKFDLLSSLAQIEISVVSGVTLTLGRMHVCGGTSANYTVALPSATGNDGKLVGVRMAFALSKFVTVQCQSGQLIDGQNARMMRAGESAILLCDGVGWTKIAGQSIPILISARDNSTQTISPNTATTLDLGVVITDVYNNVNLTNDTITIPRTGLYQLFFSASLYDISARSSEIDASYSVNGTNFTGDKRYVEYLGPGTQTQCYPTCNRNVQLSAGDVVKPQLYSGPASAKTLGASPYNVYSTITMREITSW